MEMYSHSHNRYADFIELRKNALSCRSKKKGKMLNQSFRLWYDDCDNEVKLISRYNDALIASTSNDDTTCLYVTDFQIDSTIINYIRRIYGVRLHKIAGKKNISQFNSYYISDFAPKTETRFVYTPGSTLVQNGVIVKVGDIREAVVDKEWSNAYTQVSKKNRAALTALHNIIPFDDVDVSDMPNHQRFRILNEWRSVANGVNQVINLVLDTPKPDGSHVARVRELLNIHTKKVNLRTLLQRFINEQRFERAKADGKLTINTVKNVPTRLDRKN